MPTLQVYVQGSRARRVAFAVDGGKRFSPAHRRAASISSRQAHLRSVSRIFGVEVDRLRTPNRLKGSAILPGPMRIQTPPATRPETAVAPKVAPTRRHASQAVAADPIARLSAGEMSITQWPKGKPLDDGGRYATTIDDW